MDDSDPLITNQFITDLSKSAGYGMSEAQRNFVLRQHVETQSRDVVVPPISEMEEKELQIDDLLKTNPVINEDRTDIDPIKLKASTSSYTLTSHGIVPGLEKDDNRIVKERRNVVSINSIQRQITELVLIPPNPDTGLYTRYDDMGNLELFNATILNNEFVPGPNDVPRPYVTINGLIYQNIYKYREPNSYEFDLPKIYTNVKTVRLISSEFPNTLGAITDLNNILILDVVDNSGNSVVNTGTETSPFSFIVFQLDPGYYNLTDLATHMENRITDVVSRFINTALGITFSVEFNSNTGQTSIILLNNSYKFHLKFWFIDNLFDNGLPISQYDNLWYKLGFQFPYDVDSDGDDLYVQERTNLFDNGINPLFTNHHGNDPANTFQNSINVPDTADYHLITPYRYPDLLQNRYIYMLVQGMETIIDVGTTTGQTVNFKNNQIFAKIVMNVPVGQVAYNSYVDSPMIYFETPLPKLRKLKFKFVDFAGTLVDFQQRNHSFTLEIIEYIDQLNMNQYSSHRGTIDRTTYSDSVKYRET